ncbi:MAG: PRC-barrel domain-containing protein [Pseudomonadota bacterium]
MALTHTPGKDTHAGPTPALVGAASLIGEGVVNLQGLNLGDIKEIMLDMRSGEVAYAVLAFGGFFGLGEKLFAVPWPALRLDTTNRNFVLDVDKERLKAAPGFNPHAWPDMSDVEWASLVQTFYGADPGRDAKARVPADGMVGGAAHGAGASSGNSIGGASDQGRHD